MARSGASNDAFGLRHLHTGYDNVARGYDDSRHVSGAFTFDGDVCAPGYDDHAVGYGASLDDFDNEIPWYENFIAMPRMPGCVRLHPAAPKPSRRYVFRVKQEFSEIFT